MLPAVRRNTTTPTLTLWDLLPKFLRPAPKPPVRASRAKPKPQAPRPKPSSRKPQATPRAAHSAQSKYDAMTRELLAAHGIKVRRWRTSMSGVAWEVRYRDGGMARFLESPKPKGPMSAAIFLHEVGHHVIGLGVHRPRCLEEYHAWAWSLAEMERRGLNITESVRRRMHRSLHYAIGKASRRGLKSLPPELVPFLTPWSDLPEQN